jgi:sugar lactone lactonase YvrE
MIRILAILLFSVVVFIGLSAALFDARYGGGDPFPDRTSTPILPGTALKLVADLPFPPGNIAISAEERIFFTYHPEGFPPYNLVELVNGQPQELKFKSDSPITIQTVLSIRIDQQNRLWILDYADHGQGQPQLIAIDLHTMRVVHHHAFSSDIAGLGSHLNDFQVDKTGTHIYIADASILALNPAIIVYDIAEKRARRLLEDHNSVTADDYIPVVEGQKMLIFGVFAIRPGVDSIALDRKGEWLYFAPVTDEQLHRVRVSDLNNASLSSDELGERVTPFANKTMSDGITSDNAGNIYISDLEHSAITRLNPNGKLETLVRDKKLRWPDGFSFGPNGWLYVTSSALQDVIMKPDQYIAEKGPYKIFKLKTDATATPGH